MTDETKKTEKTGKEPQPQPKPPNSSKSGLPINPRDMTPGRRGSYETR